ncbi:MAG: JmjC domain-containing protein [Janthinobacterium lividum]
MSVPSIFPPGFDTAAFLRDHWQKKPLLIRGDGTAWRNPIDPDDLAGLAGEDGVEARIVTRTKKTWKLEHGPFEASRFAKPGRKPWTLLVQAVDHAVPEVAALIEPFRFVPNWRIDDVMVSYAVDGGGVGPHFDQYDVFLIQGLGRRRWQVGGVCDTTTPLLPHDDLRLLADFAAIDEWVLEPGDMLYVPPGIAHDGVAVGDDCMTYSVGFRAPSRAELISNWCDHLLDGLGDDDRYADPRLGLQANPGEITPDAIGALHAMVTAKLADRDAFARWFGEYNSVPKDAEIDWRPDEPVKPGVLREALAKGVALQRNPASRLSFVRRGDGVVLFTDGRSFDCDGVARGVAERLCAEVTVVFDLAVVEDSGAMTLIAALIDQGSIALDD